MPQPDVAPPPPLTRWGIVWRTTVVVGLYLLFALVTMAEQEDPGTHRPDAWVLVDLFVGAASLVVVRADRRAPVRTALLLGAMSTVSGTTGSAWLLSMVSLSTRRRPREIAPAVVVGYVGTIAQTVVIPEVVGGYDPGMLFTTIAYVVTAAFIVLLGYVVGGRRELVTSLRLRAETAERAEQVRMVQAREAERLRIAREMHDVLAHRISLVAMHAGALTYRPDLPEAERAMVTRTIADNATEALRELREVLGVLRAPDEAELSGTGEAPEAPQPTLHDLARLVADNRAAGQVIEVEVAGDVDLQEVPHTLGRTAYRIVQEGLTNARKHAPGAAVQLVFTAQPGRELTVEVHNTARTLPVSDLPSSGLGLIGLAERVSLAGGQLTTRRGPAGGFTLSARLPWPS